MSHFFPVRHTLQISGNNGQDNSILSPRITGTGMRQSAATAARELLCCCRTAADPKSAAAAALLLFPYKKLRPPIIGGRIFGFISNM